MYEAVISKASRFAHSPFIRAVLKVRLPPALIRFRRAAPLFCLQMSSWSSPVLWLSAVSVPLAGLS